MDILGRAFDLLTGEAGFAPEDIVLDPNVLAVATGSYATMGLLAAALALVGLALARLT